MRVEKIWSVLHSTYRYTRMKLNKYTKYKKYIHQTTFEAARTVIKHIVSKCILKGDYSTTKIEYININFRKTEEIKEKVLLTLVKKNLKILFQ